jgi:hypothetical protein
MRKAALYLTGWNQCGLCGNVETVFNYPTLAGACKMAALDVWNRITG